LDTSHRSIKTTPSRERAKESEWETNGPRRKEIFSKWQVATPCHLGPRFPGGSRLPYLLAAGRWLPPWTLLQYPPASPTSPALPHSISGEPGYHCLHGCPNSPPAGPGRMLTITMNTTYAELCLTQLLCMTNKRR